MNEKDRKEGEQPEEDQAKVGADQEEREKPPLSEVENLRQQLEPKELEAKQNHERFLRQLAEMENFKKRTAREKEETIKYGNEGLVRDLLPILDNLERASAIDGRDPMTRQPLNEIKSTETDYGKTVRNVMDAKKNRRKLRRKLRKQLT